MTTLEELARRVEELERQVAGLAEKTTPQPPERPAYTLENL